MILPLKLVFSGESNFKTDLSAGKVILVDEEDSVHGIRLRNLFKIIQVNSGRCCKTFFGGNLDFPK